MAARRPACELASAIQAAQDRERQTQRVLRTALGDALLPSHLPEQPSLAFLAQAAWALGVPEPSAEQMERRIYALEVQRQRRLAADARRATEEEHIRGAARRAEGRLRQNEEQSASFESEYQQFEAARDSRGQELAMIGEKRKQYNTEVDILQEEMAQNGFEADVRVVVHQEKQRQLQELHREHEAVAAQLRKFRDLWPRVSLARIRLDKAKEELRAVRAENRSLLARLGSSEAAAGESTGSQLIPPPDAPAPPPAPERRGEKEEAAP